MRTFFVFNNFFLNKYDQYDDIEVDTVSFLYSIKNNNNNKRKAKNSLGREASCPLLHPIGKNFYLMKYTKEKGKKKYWKELGCMG